jgi:hypothetical protein
MRFAGRRPRGQSCIPGTFVAGVLQPMRLMGASPEVDRDAGRTPELNIVLNFVHCWASHDSHRGRAVITPFIYLVKGPPTVSFLQTQAKIRS